MKMQLDKISIIVPVYNVEQYITRCIESIISQTYRNIEILLVDDGSTDNSGNICDKYQKKDSRITIFHKTNGGLSDARNYGIKHASGQYLCFVDSDDYISKHMVEILYNNLIKYSADISACGFLTVHDGTCGEKKSAAQRKIYTKEEALKELLKDSSFSNYAWNKMYKRTLFNGVEYPIRKKMEDLGTTYKLILNANKLVYDSSKLYYYYQREDSILHKPDKQLYCDKFDLVCKRYFDLKIEYPDMIDNDVATLTDVLSCYAYIEKSNDRLENIKKIKETMTKAVVKHLKYTTKIKYMIFCFNTNLYTLLFGYK